jgi:hypothetical protein
VIIRFGYARTVLQAAVTKEYREDIAGPHEGDFDYRWWEYTFDFGGVIYRARVYVDQPASAYLLQTTDVRTDDPDRLRVLAFIHSHLADEGVTELAMIGVGVAAMRSSRRRAIRASFLNCECVSWPRRGGSFVYSRSPISIKSQSSPLVRR